MDRRWTIAGVLVFGSLAMARPVEAQQPFESVGNRALGMAGAFVAVADDATAVYWNPAGLAVGGKVGATFSWSSIRSGDPKAAPLAGANGRTVTFTTIGGGPLGLSYGRFRDTVLTTGTSGAVGLQTFETSQFGATLLQSISRHLFMGSTLKYVRGALTTGLSSGATMADALDDGLKLKSSREGRFDLDLGFLITSKRARLGLTARNIRQPVFSDAAGVTTRLKRQTRAGFALLPTRRVTLAMDVDVDAVDFRGSPRRMIAAGLETRVSSALTLRGGVRWNQKVSGGIRQPVMSGGASLRLRAGLWLEGFYSQSRVDTDRGFGFGLRAGS